MLRIILACGLFALAAPLWAAEPISRTFSIVAIDPTTGECGAAVASKFPAVGRVVPYVRADVGAFCTQHYHVPAWGEPALDLLAKGKSPADVVVELLAKDDRPEQRQFGLIDMQGRTAVHNPTQADERSQWWGAMTGKHYCVQGNTLAGQEVVLEMARAFEKTKGSLADRLVAALVAGDLAGGDHRGRLAAGMRIAKKNVEGVYFELHVDRSDDAVIELWKKYIDTQHDAKGDWPGGKEPFIDPRK